MTVNGESRSALHLQHRMRIRRRFVQRARTGERRRRTLSEEVQGNDGEDKDDGEGEDDDGVAVDGSGRASSSGGEAKEGSAVARYSKELKRCSSFSLHLALLVSLHQLRPLHHARAPSLEPRRPALHLLYHTSPALYVLSQLFCSISCFFLPQPAPPASQFQSQTHTLSPGLSS